MICPEILLSLRDGSPTPTPTPLKSVAMYISVMKTVKSMLAIMTRLIMRTCVMHYSDYSNVEYLTKSVTLIMQWFVLYTSVMKQHY